MSWTVDTCHFPTLLSLHTQLNTERRDGFAVGVVTFGAGSRSKVRAASNEFVFVNLRRSIDIVCRSR
jgi:hypothetical protein